jgi:predicted transcriptional regulator
MAGLHRRRKRTTSADDYATMLTRMMASYGKRIGDDPAASLAHLRDLESALTDATNHGLYLANKVGGHSINELADHLGVSKQAVFKRVGLGAEIARQRERRQQATLRAAKPRELPPGSTTG